MTTEELAKLDAEIATTEQALYELVLRRREETQRRRLQEITDIFAGFQPKLQIENVFRHQLEDLNNALFDLKIKLINEANRRRTDNFPQETARVLKTTLDIVLSRHNDLATKHRAIESFRRMARNARFSHETKVGIAAVAGGLFVFALWLTLTLSTVGLTGLVAFANIGFGALIVPFGASTAAARYDSAMRDRNPHERRGKAVCDSFVALLRARQQLHQPRVAAPLNQPQRGLLFGF